MNSKIENELYMGMASEVVKGALNTLKQRTIERLEKAQWRLEEAARESAEAEVIYKDLEDQLAVLGVTPATIGKEIAKLEAQLRGV